MMHNYRIRANSHLHDLMETADPKKSPERQSQDADKDMTGDELFIIDLSSSLEDDECCDIE